MTRLPPLPDLSCLSDAEKDALIVALGAGPFAGVRSVIDTGRQLNLTAIQTIRTTLDGHPVLTPT